ncbi:COG1361 S-layer family protein, partial [Geoglobus sp.]
MKVRRIMVFSAALVAFLMVAVPVSADSADFRFHITPVRDTFYPGEETVLTLLIENDAKVSGFVVNENTSNLLPLITTARNLRIELNSKPPVEVKTINPQLAGDLPPGIVTKASFRIKIDPDAEEKEYELTVKIHYTYASYSIDPATNIAVITYDDDVYQKTVSILVSKKEYDFSIDILNSTAISGRESVVKAEIVNTCKNPVYDAYVVMNATPPLMANPGAMVVYVGDLSPGESKTVNFKVYTAENALNQSYPVNFILRFSDAAGYPKTLMKT